ncbi:hypothetical protein OPQ81_005326 [Rhizoctonia solani]|nr:hypothetical protein OPQ81_005326 [Rhizoctonia solani]
MSTIILPIIHFNDVYNMTTPSDNKVIRDGELTRTSFDRVVQFSEKVNEIRARWTENAEKANELRDPEDKEQEETVEHGLVLFSGDLFSPSVESILTKGRNMVHLMNELAPDACVPGNHEFDYGRERFNQLTEFCNFNWILSNVKEYPKSETNEEVNFQARGKLLHGLREYSVFKRGDLVIGVIGLMSKSAIESTLAEAKKNLKADDMKQTCLSLSEKLRRPKDQDGEGCHIVLALTHAEHNEDVALGRELNAYPSTKRPGLEHMEGVDAIFGGHNHKYFLGRGVELQNEGDTLRPKNKEKDDDGLLIVKSGYDFKDFSEVTLELEEKPDGKCRKYVIKSLKVERHNMPNITIKADNIKKSSMQRILHRQFQNEVMRGLETPVASLPEPVKFSSEDPRKYETPIGNWISDMILKAYNEMEMDKNKPPLVPTIFMITGGSIRSNGLPTRCRARDIIGLLPFPSTPVALKLTGQAIVDALEGALALSGTGDQAPANPDDEKDAKQNEADTKGGDKKDEDNQSDVTSSGRFPVFSGIRVQWDSTKPQNSRVHEVLVPKEKGGDWEAINVDQEYCVLTNDYLAEGNIGFDSFKKPLQRFKSDLPLFHILLNYIRTLYSLAKLEETLKGLDDDFMEGKHKIPGIEIDPNNIQDWFNLTARVDEFVNKLDAIDQKLDQAQLAKLIKRAASALYGLTSDSYIPPLEIKKVDGRMVDISKIKEK